MEFTKKFYVNIEMSDRTAHQIWTVVVDSESTSTEDYDTASDKIRKPTLVLVHGFASASCHFVTYLPELMKHYRIVMFDNLSFGCNPKDG